MSTEIAKKANSEVAENQSFSGCLMENLTRVEDALPKGFNKARFVQNCVALLNDNPQLQKYKQKSNCFRTSRKEAIWVWIFIQRNVIWFLTEISLITRLIIVGQKNSPRNIPFARLKTYMQS